MKSKILFTAIFLIITILSVNCQSSISGIIKDDVTGEPVPFVNVTLNKDNNIITGAYSDFNGYYEIKPVTPGIYDVVFSYIGYNTVHYNKYIVEDNQNYTINVNLSNSEKILSNVEVAGYSVAKMPKNRARKGKYRSLNYATGIDLSNYNTEAYDYINENKFKNVFDEPLSTFSIDVDRASYSNVRRFLNRSAMPNIDAVRIEEMINYFDYNYEQPAEEHPFNTYLELGECPWNPANKLLLIGIQGKSFDENNIPPSNLVFLIDVSGSMYSQEKLPLLKSSLNILIDKLRPQDKVSIVVYAGSAGCVLPSTSGNNKEKIRKAINKLEAGGSTAGEAGIKLAYKIAVENYIKDGNNRVILATDGDFNVGPSSNSELERLIEKNRDKGVYLTILGFGMGNYKDATMENLSNKGNGNYAYVDNINEANKIFGHELWGTLYTIADDVKIQIEFNPSKVKEYRLIGYENRLMNKEDFNNDTKDAGEVGSGHSVTVLYEIVSANGKYERGNTDPLNYQTTNIVESEDIMTLKIRYKNPGENNSNLIENKITDDDVNVKENSDNFIFAAAIAEFGMLLRDSEHKGISNYDHVVAMAKKAKGEDKFDYRSEFISLVKKAKILSEHGSTYNNNK
ncbi:MAG: von Willebrand factor type A domain-containing protein [Bacteroidales bacterium]|jgi:Ca-activated chloride channel family protein|nr:von Willebrand factor type A domain-containing protein [Bacteroidales bacterium]